MIRFLEGTVIETGLDGAIVLTKAGIGYLVRTAVTAPLGIGSEIQLYTHLAVRENALDLYGFKTTLELQFFELLLTIPKIGPKSAMQIMDQAHYSLICEAVTLNDAGHLSKLSGIGKKTSEKIIQALAGKVDGFAAKPDNSQTQSLPTYQDAFDTLVTLGFNPAEIRATLETATANESTSDLVRRALKELS